MENIQNYDEFVNEGFWSKSLLALSLAMSTLFANVNKAEAAVVVPVVYVHHSEEYPDEFKTIQDNYNDVMGILRGLLEHVKDPQLKSLLEEMSDFKDEMDHMGSKTFLVRMNVIKPKLISIIKKYGISDYKIEQIYKHIESKDFKRLSVDFGYIKNELDNISAKYKVTEYEKMSAGDVATDKEE